MRPFDETTAQPAAYRALLGQVNGNAAALAEDVQRHVDDDGCMFSAGGDHGRFLVDPLPRVIPGPEWDVLARGLEQRVEALERFLGDIHAEQRVVGAGVVPQRVVDTAAHHDRRAGDLRPRTWITVAGLDLVRTPDGRFAVLEDNVRTPSGLGYMQAVRRAVAAHFTLPGGRRIRPLDGVAPALLAALRAAAPEGADDPLVVVLTDGHANPAFWEHRALAEAMGIPWVTTGDLRVEQGRLRYHGRTVDVVYRRTNEDRLTGALAALLLEPLRAGTVVVANAFGSGVADDKLIHAYVEDMIRFYLGEEPELPSVRTYDLGCEGVLEEVLDRLGELVVKPRAGHGGNGVVIGPRADRDTLELTRRLVRACPEDHVAQEVVLLSEHPTVRHGELAPRHVDLRPFVISSPARRFVVPGGLTRVAFGEGAMIVNSSQNGGAKDTWVLD